MYQICEIKCHSRPLDFCRFRFVVLWFGVRHRGQGQLSYCGLHRHFVRLLRIVARRGQFVHAARAKTQTSSPTANERTDCGDPVGHGVSLGRGSQYGLAPVQLRRQRFVRSRFCLQLARVFGESRSGGVDQYVIQFDVFDRRGGSGLGNAGAHSSNHHPTSFNAGTTNRTAHTRTFHHRNRTVGYDVKYRSRIVTGAILLRLTVFRYST